jgi:hypothetical protein
MIKRLLILLVVGAAALAGWQSLHPSTAAADDSAGSDTTADASADSADSGIGARVKHNIGKFTVRIAGNQIRASIRKTERQLGSMQPAIDRVSEPSHTRAITVSRKIIVLDSLALVSLDAAHPVTAIKQAIDARRFISLVHEDVLEETAAQ